MALSNPALERAHHQPHRRSMDFQPRRRDPADRAASRPTPASSTSGAASKRDNKQVLAALIRDRTGVSVDPQSLFDIQVKRLHEYKRQHLNVLYVITLYNRLTRTPEARIAPRTVIFGGKAAPGYRMAKLIIKLINSVAAVVNARRRACRSRLKVVFLPDFNVKTRPARLSGGRPVRTDLHGRQGGLGHGQHEVRDERGADDRHARRRQRRDSRRGRRRELLPLRPHGRRGDRAQGARLPAGAITTNRTPSCARPSTSSTAASSPTAIASCSGRWSNRC